ncbi:MAG: TMEM175 family protein [Myxococcaceae bacterium]
MHKSRLEAFSDGVLAIILTIMVLGLKVPDGVGVSALLPLTHVFLCYVLSFVYIAIYWSNHHHLFQIVKHVNGPILWANSNLLFWLSMIPFVTAWAGENHFAEVPVALYGLVLLLAALSYFILTRALLASHGQGSDLEKALGSDIKGKISVALYALAIPIALIVPYLALAIYVLVAGVWIVPDRRIEKVIHD